MDDTTPIEIGELRKKLEKVELPKDLASKTNDMIVRLERLAKMQGNYAPEYDSANRYIDWVINLPWNKRSEDNLDLKNAAEILEKNHYGLGVVKNKILEYLAVMSLELKKRQEMAEAGQSQFEQAKFNRAPILLLVGLAGTGKTTIAYSIAEAMGRKFARIPFGGIGDTMYLRGQSRAFPDAEPGAVIKSLRQTGYKNCVILLDEIDRVDEHGRTSIMGVLVELLDPEQNAHFTDHFLDYPFDLSEVLFIATSNNTAHISTAVMDRLEPIRFPSYTDEEKITIGRDYVLPRILRESGLSEDIVMIAPELWPKIVRPFGFDPGIRTLERTLSNLVRKAAKMIISGEIQKVLVNEQNVKQFIQPQQT